MKLEALKQKMENQIDAIIDTIVEIEKLEQEKPWRELSERHQIGATMIGFHILMRSLWKEFEGKELTQEQREEYITEVADMTKEHYKNLYYFDTMKLWQK